MANKAGKKRKVLQGGVSIQQPGVIKTDNKGCREQQL